MTETDRDKIIEALELVKKVHKFVSLAPYHKDTMEFVTIRACAMWNNELRDGKHDELILAASKIKVDSEQEEQPKKTVVIKDGREVVAAGQFFDLLYEMRDNQLGHEIEITVPDEKKETWVRKVVVSTRASMQESFSKISEVVNWIVND
jgi:hypothetical protein